MGAKFSRDLNGFFALFLLRHGALAPKMYLRLKANSRNPEPVD
jgi:hypothetical protein